MRRHEVSRTRDYNTEDSHKAEKKRRQQNRRLSVHQSATSATQDLNRFSILCDCQKHTTCLNIHYNACQKQSNFLNRPKYTVSPLLFTWNIMATARGQGFKQLTPHIQIPSRSAHQTFRIRSHGSSSHCAFHIQVLLLAEQCLGESVTAISPSTLRRLGLSDCLEALLPMECVPEIPLCLEPALNRESQHLR